jgi:uncharacterized protein
MSEALHQAFEAFEAKDYPKAYGIFEEAAHNNPDAMVNLAIMHMQGKGCEQSYELAESWFEKAAKAGNIKAQYSLGMMYEKGMTGAVDEKKSLEYYKQAANGGHVDSQLKAGMLLKQQNEVAEAMRYLIAAAHNGNTQAQSIITYASNSDIATERNDAFYGLDTERQRKLIENLIATKIRPTLAVDGGGIELINFIPGEKPQVWLHYQGTCSGCHLGSTSTADMILDHFETMIDKNVILYLM